MYADDVSLKPDVMPFGFHLAAWATYRPHFLAHAVSWILSLTACLGFPTTPVYRPIFVVPIRNPAPVP